MEISNISLYQYLILEDKSDYDFYGKFMKPENRLCGQVCDTSKITFNEFHTMLSIFQSPNLQDIKDLFVHLYRIKGTFEKSIDEMFFNEKVFQFFKARNFLEKYLTDNIELEEKMMAGEIDDKMLQIQGYKRLKPYNVLLTKMKIGEQFGLDPETVGNWNYTKVRQIMSANSMENQIKKEYERLS